MPRPLSCQEGFRRTAIAWPRHYQMLGHCHAFFFCFLSALLFFFRPCLSSQALLSACHNVTEISRSLYATEYRLAGQAGLGTCLPSGTLALAFSLRIEVWQACLMPVRPACHYKIGLVFSAPEEAHCLPSFLLSHRQQAGIFCPSPSGERMSLLFSGNRRGH